MKAARLMLLRLDANLLCFAMKLGSEGKRLYPTVITLCSQDMFNRPEFRNTNGGESPPS